MWEIIFMVLILKIPMVYVCWVIWWAIKAEPVAVKDYRMTSRRLPPGATTEGTVVFERPAFKESREQLLLQIAQAEEVDRPVLAPIAFVAPSKGRAK